MDTDQQITITFTRRELVTLLWFHENDSADTVEYLLTDVLFSKLEPLGITAAEMDNYPELGDE